MPNSKKLLQAAAGSAGGAGLDIDEVFQTTLWTGTADGSTGAQDITTDIDLANNEGMLWLFNRDNATAPHIFDTIRGANVRLRTDRTTESGSVDDVMDSFNSDGFRLGVGTTFNQSTVKNVGFTFKSEPNFFDIVTYNGTGSHPRNVSHNLGSVPAMIIVKNLDDGTEDWIVYHRGVDSSAPEDYGMFLNLTDSRVNNDSYWGDTAPTSTTFTVGGNITNQSGENFIAYLFAHNDGDGEFGPDGDADVIKGGSFTEVSGSDVKVTLGFEPQWIMIKASNATGGWGMYDVMRGWTSGGDDFALTANTSSAESNVGDRWLIHPDGFTWKNTGNTRDIMYTAIRRGPLAAPDDATKVFSMDTQGGSAPYFDSNHIVDMSLVKALTITGDWDLYTRLLGEKSLATNTTAAEATASEAGFDFMDGHIDANWGSGFPRSAMWKRAPSFFDVVCYDGNSASNRQIPHNLGVQPEMIWIKCRSASDSWHVSTPSIWDDALFLNTTDAINAGVSGLAGADNLTATNFSVGSGGACNGSGNTYVAYLFATVEGVSKVGTFSLSGSDIDVDCGFSSGARWVMIKRTDGTGNWFQFDTLRGFGVDNDSTIYLNTTDDEELADYIDPLSSGFSIESSSWDNGDYIFYAIA